MFFSVCGPRSSQAKSTLPRILPISVVGDANPARLGDALETHGDVDAVTEDIVLIDDDIADVQADPELDLGVRRDSIVLRRHAALNLDRAARGIDRTGRLDQHAVAGGLDDTPSMRGDGGFDEGPSDRLQPGQGVFLVQRP